MKQFLFKRGRIDRLRHQRNEREKRSRVFFAALHLLLKNVINVSKSLTAEQMESSSNELRRRRRWRLRQMIHDRRVKTSDRWQRLGLVGQARAGIHLINIFSQSYRTINNFCLAFAFWGCFAYCNTTSPQAMKMAKSCKEGAAAKLRTWVEYRRRQGTFTVESPLISPSSYDLYTQFKFMCEMYCLTVHLLYMWEM